jgi:thiol-disulfide isomerase/thioredoxin
MKKTMVSRFWLMVVLGCWSLSSVALEVESGAAKLCSLKDLSGSKEISVASLKGKVVYLDFWASWCGPCALSFPYMNEIAQKKKADGLELVAVSVDESKEDAENFLRQHPAGFSVAHDPEGACPKEYGIQTMPTSYLIDRKGNVRFVHRGFNNSDKDELSATIDVLLKENK